jgi:hypothetical protein
MKKSDARFLAQALVKRVVQASSEDTRVALISFDESAKMVVPLTEVYGNVVDLVITNVNRLNYQGHATNIPNAVWRASYELKTYARAESMKWIVLLTDGVVDTGSAVRNLDRLQWLREDLTEDAFQNHIKILAIALGNNADTLLLQYLAEQTDGGYIWASGAGDLPAVLEHIYQAFARVTTPQKPAEPEPKVAEEPVQAPPIPEPAVSPAPQQTEAPATAPVAPALPSVPDQVSDRTSYTAYGFIVGMLLLVITLILMVMRMLIRSGQIGIPLAGAASRLANTPAPQPPQALFYDLSGVTGIACHILTGPLTVIGRVPPNSPEENVNYIVIDKPTIGRRHAVIERKQHGFWLIDQNSKNGTFVNDHPVTDAVCLTHGDRVRFHTIEFEFALAGIDLADRTIVIDRRALKT